MISGYLRYIVIKLDPKNANRGTDTGRRMVRQSIEDYGAGRSVLLDQDDTVIAGNKTVEAAQEMGIPIRVVETDGTELLAVKRTDIDLDTPRGRELAIADNRAAETGLDWDTDVLLGLQDKGTDLSLFWGDDEINTWKKDIPEAPDADIDQAEALREKWHTATGQLWKIGDHRLLCGDCTNPQDVDRVLDGDVPMLMVTDPPYGVEYNPNWRNEAAEAGVLAYSARRIGQVSNDDRVDWSEAWALYPGDILYAWSPGGDHIIQTGQAIIDSGFIIRNQIIWVKPHFPISRGAYTYQHEPCWYAVRDGATAAFVGPKNESTTWNITLDKNVDGGHSTQKPLECMERPIRNHSGDVYEPFAGSGTTIVAAERQRRKCYAIEIDPAYVAVTLERMSKMDITPELIDGQT